MYPNAVLNASDVIMQIHSGTPEVIIEAARMFDNARLAPTERSIPPVMMTKVCPIAIMAMTAVCIAMVFRFNPVRKYGLIIDRTIMHSTSIPSAPYFSMNAL